MKTPAALANAGRGIGQETIITKSLYICAGLGSRAFVSVWYAKYLAIYKQMVKISANKRRREALILCG
jgi:hypothetical protein